MSQILVVGPPSLAVAATLELTTRGYVQVGPTIDRTGANEVFIEVDHGKKQFAEMLHKVVDFDKDSPNYFELPGGWADFETELNEPKLDITDEPSTEVGVNPHDPQGIVKEIDGDTLSFLLPCPKCGHFHSRHAGYLISVSAYKNVDERQGSTFTNQIPVYICVNCKTPIASIGGKMYNVSKYVDVKAWVKTEQEAHEATGPGGQC